MHKKAIDNQENPALWVLARAPTRKGRGGGGGWLLLGQHGTVLSQVHTFYKI